jgi:hypothetical protein
VFPSDPEKLKQGVEDDKRLPEVDTDNCLMQDGERYIWY